MKERPILFTAESVRAILDGRKTQTRRVVKESDDLYEHEAQLYHPSSYAKKCPCGKRYDRLWVRESWRPWEDEHLGTSIQYQADMKCVKPVFPSHNIGWRCMEASYATDREKWHTSLFMPRWASRITLEITGVRAELLHDISEEDAKAEGCESKSEYEKIWDSINAKRGFPWAWNHWVWVIEFRRLTNET